MGYYKEHNYKSMILTEEMKQRLDMFKYRLQVEAEKRVTFTDMFNILIDSYEETHIIEEAI